MAYIIGNAQKTFYLDWFIIQKDMAAEENIQFLAIFEKEFFLSR